MEALSYRLAGEGLKHARWAVDERNKANDSIVWMAVNTACVMGKMPERV
ncbi:hypothetical protein [Kordiimonas sp.]